MEHFDISTIGGLASLVVVALVSTVSLLARGALGDIKSSITGMRAELQAVSVKVGDHGVVLGVAAQRLAVLEAENEKLHRRHDELVNTVQGLALRLELAARKSA